MSTASPGRNRANIEISLFGFLVSLTLKAGLDTAYKDTITKVTSGSELLQTVLVPASLLLIIFLITLLRFVYGAYRFNDEAQESHTKLKSWAQLWNISATLMLFVFFYVTGLSIQHAKPFFIGLIVVHVWDLIWFVSTVVSSDILASNLRKVMQKFIVIDLVTILLLGLTMYLFNGHYRGKAALVMLSLAFADLYWNRQFFFHPEEWRKSTPKAEEQTP